MKVNFKIIAAHEYECDKCATRIHTGSEFYDCRKCDYDLCTDCNATFTKSLVTSMSHKKESPITTCSREWQHVLQCYATSGYDCNLAVTLYESYILYKFIFFT